MTGNHFVAFFLRTPIQVFMRNTIQKKPENRGAGYARTPVFGELAI
jgi:hypothetical protein